MVTTPEEIEDGIGEANPPGKGWDGVFRLAVK